MKRKRWGKWAAVWILAMFVAVSPYGQWVDLTGQGSENVEASLLELGLLGNAQTEATFSNGILSVNKSKTVLLDIRLLNGTYYAELQFPESLSELIAHKDFREHIRFIYSIPGNRNGFVPKEELNIDENNRIISAEIKLAEVGLLTQYSFTFLIDIHGLNMNIAQGDYEFKMNIGDALINLKLLSLDASKDTVPIRYTRLPEGDLAQTQALVNILPEQSYPPDIVDPENPRLPYEPEEPPTGNMGALTIDHVTSIAFGTQLITSESTSYPAQTPKPFVQVTDKRGTGEGWRLTARANTFKSEKGQTLPGAELILSGGSVVSATNGQPPDVNLDVRLTPGGSSILVTSASPGRGLGTWTTRWLPSGDSDKNDNVTLVIPGGVSSPGTHTAEITWTLLDAP